MDGHGDAAQGLPGLSSTSSAGEGCEKRPPPARVTTSRTFCGIGQLSTDSAEQRRTTPARSQRGGMRNTLKFPPELQTAPFSTSSAAALGVGPWRPWGGAVEHPFRGVHRIARPTDADEPGRADLFIEQLCDAYLVRMRAEQWFSHQTAALLGIPLPPRIRPTPVHVSVRSPRTPPRAGGVVGHRISADVRVGVVRDRYPTCPPVDIWCQLSTQIRRSDLVAAGDFLVGARKRAPVVDVAGLAAATDRYGGKRGAADRAWALERIRFGADSPPETLLRLRLVEAGLPEPLVQVRCLSMTAGLCFAPTCCSGMPESRSSMKAMATASIAGSGTTISIAKSCSGGPASRWSGSRRSTCSAVAMSSTSDSGVSAFGGRKVRKAAIARPVDHFSHLSWRDC